MTMIIHKVSIHDAGDYTCTPYNDHGTSGTSGVMQVDILNSLSKPDSKLALILELVHMHMHIQSREEQEYRGSSEDVYINRLQLSWSFL